MKFLFDFFPVLVFFCTFRALEFFPTHAQRLSVEYLGALSNGGPGLVELAPVLLASAAAIIAGLAQLIYVKARRRAIDPMLWVSVASIIICGAPTIYFHDADFIKWKPTVQHWSFALTLMVSQLFFKKNLVRLMLGWRIKLPEAYWDKVGFNYIIFFLAYGCVNLMAAFVIFTNDFGAYVTFKTFGMPAIFLLFATVQTLHMSPHMQLAHRPQRNP